MDEWIFKRPPYRSLTVELPGKVDRFDFRVMFRYDRSLAQGADNLEKISDVIYEALHLLEKRFKEVFGDEFLLDDDSPFLCGPRRSPQGVDEFFIIVGSDFFKRRK